VLKGVFQRTEEHSHPPLLLQDDFRPRDDANANAPKVRKCTQKILREFEFGQSRYVSWMTRCVALAVSVTVPGTAVGVGISTS
jgi:hypothetical protein